MSESESKKGGATIIRVDFRTPAALPLPDETPDTANTTEGEAEKRTRGAATSDDPPATPARARRSRAKSASAADDGEAPAADPAPDDAPPRRARRSRAKDTSTVDAADAPAADAAPADAPPKRARRSRAADKAPADKAPPVTPPATDGPATDATPPAATGPTRNRSATRRGADLPPQIVPAPPTETTASPSASIIDGPKRTRRRGAPESHTPISRPAASTPIVVEEDEKLIRVDFASLHREREQRAAEASMPENPATRMRRVLARNDHGLSPEAVRKAEFFTRSMEAGLVTLTINGASPGATLPPHLQGNPGVHLNFSLRFLIPDMDWDEKGVRATLSFNQQPAFCDLPWSSIYLMRSRELGEVSVDPSSCPPAMLPQLMALLRGLGPPRDDR